MRISKESLQGYVLEEVLASMLRDTGFRVIAGVHPDDGDLEFTNALYVRGRGGRHQVDVLGELSWVPAFCFPIRLFVEAKCRSGTTGIDVVRHAVGILHDVRERTFEPKEPRQFHSYQFAVFSTSGFSAQAVSMALCHGISLVDLGLDEFRQVRTAIEDFARRLIVSVENTSPNLTRRGFVSEVRSVLRRRLETQTIGDSGDLQAKAAQVFLNDRGEYDQVRDSVDDACTDIVGDLGRRRFVVGMANGPFLLAMQADSYERFRDYAIENLTHSVTITWDESQEDTWVVNPVSAGETEPRYTLKFRLPSLLAKWVFERHEGVQARAWDAKGRFLNRITAYVQDGNVDRIVTLKFDRAATELHLAL